MAHLGSRFFDDSGRGVDRFGLLLSVTVLSVITQMMVDLHADPVSAQSALGVAVVTIFTGATLLLAFRSSGARRRWMRLADVLVGISVMATLLLLLLSVVGPDDGAQFATAGTPSVIWVLLTVLSPIVVVRRLLQHRTVSTGTLLGAVTVFLLIALAFNYLFLTADAYQGTPFFGQPETSTSFMYFSMVTVTTLGYGDLTAVTELGRLLAVSEAVIGQVFLVTFVAMIVGLLAQDWRRRHSTDDDDGNADGRLFDAPET